MVDRTVPASENGLEEPGNDGNGGSGATLATSVYGRIRDDIMTGSLRPGEKLRAEFLRDRYQAGNSPIREALNRLSVDGFVAREEQRGFRVASVSREELQELTDTRCWLEEVALRQTIENRDTRWEEELVLAFHRLSRVPRSSKEGEFERNPKWDDLHRAFHMALIANCGSRWLLGFCEHLNDQADRYRRLSSITYPTRDPMEEHRAIVDAAIDGRADDAVRMLHDHYRRTGDIILKSDYDFSAD
ncbi:MAG: GntR family transcriptional regulator [Pseudomonadota bacterium]